MFPDIQAAMKLTSVRSEADINKTIKPEKAEEIPAPMTTSCIACCLWLRL